MLHRLARSINDRHRVRHISSPSSLNRYTMLHLYKQPLTCNHRRRLARRPRPPIADTDILGQEILKNVDILIDNRTYTPSRLAVKGPPTGRRHRCVMSSSSVEQRKFSPTPIAHAFAAKVCKHSMWHPFPLLADACPWMPLKRHANHNVRSLDEP